MHLPEYWEILAKFAFNQTLLNIDVRYLDILIKWLYQDWNLQRIAQYLFFS